MAINPNGRRLTIGRAVVLVAVTAAILSGCSKGGTKTNDGGYVTGDGSLTRVEPKDRKPAPPLSGDDLYGRPLSAETIKGKVLVVNIWGSWCPPCRKETPVLNKVAEELESEGVQFLGIAVREGAAASRAFAEGKKVPYPSISDSGGALLIGFSSSLPAIAIPTTYVIDRKGRVAARIMDVVTEITLRDLVTDVAKEP